MKDKQADLVIACGGWPVNFVADLKLAPFHLLATEGKVHVDQPHDWHMQTLARLAGGIIVATPFRIIDVTTPESEAEGIHWWEEMTGRGGEGMVVKPLDFIAKNRHGLVQPAVKCRGREYLRIIYGPEYTAAENLERLRAAAFPRNARWRCANLLSASKPSNDSCAENCCAACMKLSLACWPLKANPLIHASIHRSGSGCCTMKTWRGSGESNVDFLMLECLLFQGEKCSEQIKAVEKCIPLAGVQVRSFVAGRAHFKEMTTVIRCTPANRHPFEQSKLNLSAIL